MFDPEEHCMPRSTSRPRVAVAAMIAGLVLIAAPRALAHVDAPVGDGDLVLGIGFLEEPAFMGYPNAVQLTVEHDGEPVTDLRSGDVLVEITFGDATSDAMEFEPLFGIPGDYVAPFIPTQPGRYTFRVSGTIDGEKVDEEMTSSDATFATVEDPAELTFPAVDAPSNEELSTRIEEESSRASDGVAAAEAAAASAQDAASSARAVGLIGVVLGAIGIIAAIAALASSRRKT